MKAMLLAFALTLSACSVPTANLQANPALTAAGEIVLQAAIRHGVSDYLAKHPASIGRTKAIVDGVLAVIDGNATTTVGALKEFAYAQIPASLSPLDQADARSLIDLVAVAVQERVGDQQLDSRALVDIRDVLGTISYAVEHYAPGG